jgi:hypothetical protein
VNISAEMSTVSKPVSIPHARARRESGMFRISPSLPPLAVDDDDYDPFFEMSPSSLPSCSYTSYSDEYHELTTDAGFPEGPKYSSPSPSITSSKWPRAFSPPRERVTANDPLCIFDDPEELSDCESEHESQQTTDFEEKKSPRKNRLRSSLNASFAALKELPNQLIVPSALFSPHLIPRTRSYSLPETPQNRSISLSESLPIFDPSDFSVPTSSSIHMQTYSISLGPPRKPREARLNSDFFRLLALEMEMRRSGKLVLPELGRDSGKIVVSGKVRMILPRREREREDVNIPTFNKSRLKW